MKNPRTSLILSLLALFLMAAGPGGAAADDEKPAQRRHPSYSLRGLDAQPAPESVLNPNFVVSTASKLAEGSLWRSGYMPERLVGLDVGDVDADGRNELAYATLRNVYLYRLSGAEYVQLATFKMPDNARSVSLDLYDVDGNGKKEIIVSAQNDSTHAANSQVLSFDGSKELKLVAGGLNHYLRVVGQENSRSLVAQKPGTAGGEMYSGPVYYASISGGKVVTSGKVELPPQVNIYNFNIGEIGLDRARLTSSIKFPTEHLTLTEVTGEKVWESHDEYGGSINYLNLYSYGDSGKNVEYLPTRIILADIDKDGANELIVAKNSLGGTRLFKNLRTFNAGAIEARKFTNLSLVPYFTNANLLPGPAVDYQLADFDNNGVKDLIIGILIEQGSGMLEEARSIIFSFNNLYTVDPEAQPAAGAQG
ncbi:MAG: VCBS repeat-containing protein, partial [Deltaproteobacteria bacterium]|nr:VCBS repeat-containing protein [Deltaproteobacteria bacterium]